jgi:hypothetical protein
MSTDRFAPLNEILPELAGAHEVLGQHEYESEWESESEAEAEGFFDRLASLVASGGISPALQRLGSAAAESAVAGVPGMESGFMPEMEDEWEDELELSPLARVYSDVAGMGGLDPISRIYPEAAMEMEHLGHVAAESPTLAEAEAHARRIVPTVVKAMPRVAHRVAHAAPHARPAHVAPRVVHAVRRAAPALAHGVSGVTRTLFRNPATRHLIRTLPTMVRNTANHLVHRAASGQPVSPHGAVRMLARQAAHVIGKPAHGVHAWRRSHALDRRYHRRFGIGGPGVWRPGIGTPGLSVPRLGISGAPTPGVWSPGMTAPGVGPRPRRAGGCGCCCCGCHRCGRGH